MSPPWDVFGVGAAVGGAAGIFAGYQLRKLVVHIQEWRENRYRKLTKEYRKLKKEAEETGQPIVTARQLPDVIPIKRSRRSTPKEQPEVSNDRNEVIAFVMGSGYQKAEAIKAVDACSLAERASGVEPWVRAALSHAARSKP